MISRLCTIFVLIAVASLDCVRGARINPTDYSDTTTISPAFNWDTVFSVDQVDFPDSEAVKRSVVVDGDHGRLAAFFKKLLSGQDVTIGYIGGSITAGALVSSQDKCFAERLAQFLRNMFNNSHITILNAGIGATNSRFGCSRIQEDLLDENPDLVVVEFASNDNPYDEFTTTASMEGMVRQCLKRPETAVIIFNTFNILSDTTVQELFKKIADHYNVPMINFENGIWPLIESGKIRWSSIGADDIHPNDMGHLIDTVKMEPEALPECRVTDLYEHAGIFHGSDSMIQEQSNSWKEEAGEFDQTGYVSLSRGDSIQLRTSVQEMVIGYYCASDMDSKIAVSVDGGAVDTVSNHSNRGAGVGYLGHYRIFCETSPSIHAITITHLDDNPFVIQYLLYASTISCFKSNPEEIFNDLNF
jgi:hypothetical protein